MSAAVRHPVIALVVWFAVVLGIIGAAMAMGGPKYNDSLALPGVESTTALNLLEKIGQGKPSNATSKVVWSPAAGQAGDAASKASITPTLQKIAQLGFVQCVATPFGVNYGRTCPKATPTDLKAALDAALLKAIMSKTKMSKAELEQAVKLLGQLAPLAEADPQKLAEIGQALPAIAQLAQAPKSELDALAKLTPDQLHFLVGLTSQDMQAATTALGYLNQLASLPASTLQELANANPAELAAVAQALPGDVGSLEKVMAEIQTALKKDPSLAQALIAVAKKYGISVAQLQDFVQLVNDLAPIASADPAKLAEIAQALPSLSKFAATNTDTIKALSGLTPEDLQPLVGLSESDIDNAIAAFGALDKFADLPPDVIDALAKADPAALAALGKALPSDIAEATKLMAEAQKEIAALEEAAAATQVSLAQISPNKKVGVATITFTSPTVSGTDAQQVVDLIDAAAKPGFTVGGAGAPLDGASSGEDPTFAIGILIAFVLLLVAFGALVAAGLPLLVAIIGLLVGVFAGYIASHAMSIPSVSLELVGMIGLGVGIDYSLFILARYQQGLIAGMEPKDAALKSVTTAGRAVLFAGTTVIVALLGMFVFHIDMFNGLAVAAALGVLFVMVSAVVMLPAIISLLGVRTFAVRMPWGHRFRPRKGADPAEAAAPPPVIDLEQSKWARYGALLQKAPLVPVLLVLLVIGACAYPALQMRLGFPDDSSAEKGSAVRVGYDLLTRGFGPGVNGPFVVVLQTQKENDLDALAAAVSDLEKTPGVASTTPSTAMLPLVKLSKSAFTGNLTAIEVIPTTSPQDQGTEDLLQRIRGTTRDSVQSATGARMYVGGALATSDDFTQMLSKSLPIFLLFVVGLGMVALIALFRSLVIPLTAAITALLSFGGALGVTVAIFQLGTADALLGVAGTGPILPFLPVMLFAVLFGLSMDYQVFLVSRMKEEWEATHINRLAVRHGLAGSGRVVVVAAAIMTAVFLGFVTMPIPTVKMFGVAFAAAVIIDAFLVRLVLIPALMTLLGRSNWWLPGWLARIVPNIKLE